MGPKTSVDISTLDQDSQMQVPLFSLRHLLCLLPVCGIEISEVIAADFIVIRRVICALQFSVPPAFLTQKQFSILMLGSDGQ